MKLIVQGPYRPERIIDAITDMIGDESSELRIGVAYITLSGTKLLAERIIEKIGEDRWKSMRKRIVTCFDYGLTEPEALRFWAAAPKSLVRVQNHSLVANGSLVPKIAFHTKYYEFRDEKQAGIMVGSSNLTERALVYNAEAATVHSGISNFNRLNRAWSRINLGSEPLDLDIVRDYEQYREHSLPNSEPSLEYQLPEATLVLWDAIESDALELSKFEYMWVDGGRLSGGSGSQLELPRGANRFFGFNFNDYVDLQARIGTINLSIKDASPAERIISWHGDNGMERINLPTDRKYDKLVMLFRRRNGHFNIDWATQGSQRTIAWAQASEAMNRLYRLGQRSPRNCGVF